MPHRAKLRTMDTAVRKIWTQEKFFEWAENQDTRYEFDGFQPAAMTGGSANADAIGGKLITALRPIGQGIPWP